MYVQEGLSGIGGYGTSDFNKALKGTNIAAIQKGIDHQRKSLAKRKPKDVRGIEADTLQLAAAEKRMAEVLAMQAPAAVAPPVATPPPPAPTITPPPVVTSAPKTDPSAYVGVPQINPTPAPPAASDAVATLAPVASNFGPPSFDTPAPVAAPAEESKMPLILGGLAVAAAFLFMRKKGR